MNNRVLGLLALIGAPTLGICSYLESVYPQLKNTWFYGVWGIVYMSAWICSLLVMQRLQATGSSRFGKAILKIAIGSLILANFSNVYAGLFPGDRPLLFIILDAFWPISNLLMLVIGITVIVKKGLSGWRRYVPLFVGLWLPTMLVLMITLGRVGTVGTISSFYSAIAWSLLAISVLIESNLKQATTGRLIYQAY
ncbi:hypothetical protein GCM10023189_18250 [Nibrella saemangeumensis]|uniref:TspO and MBR related proteins n=1 Tax=Nibrella saemangeumensis TaxID=1084526 RepID=A0ABP8MQG9_9BACT